MKINLNHLWIFHFLGHVWFNIRRDLKLKTSFVETTAFTLKNLRYIPAGKSLRKKENWTVEQQNIYSFSSFLNISLLKSQTFLTKKTFQITVIHQLLAQKFESDRFIGKCCLFRDCRFITLRIIFRILVSDKKSSGSMILLNEGRLNKNGQSKPYKTNPSGFKMSI